VGSYEVAGWVLPESARILMTWLAHYVGYAYDDSDGQALEMALPATDADSADGMTARWLDRPVRAPRPCHVIIADRHAVGGHPSRGQCRRPV
jgi:hypothetical protein